MHALQSLTHSSSEPLTRDALERRLERERAARQEAEGLLEKKSFELYSANQELRASAEMRERERMQLDAVFHASSAALILTDENLRIVRANKRAVSFLGLDQSAAARETLRDFIHSPQSAIDWVSDRAGPDASFDEGSCEAYFHQPSGEPAPVRIKCAEIGYGDLRIWTIRDIRRQLAAEQARQALERELSQAQKMEALGTLASGVAHEINTPIQYISDNTRFMRDAISDVSELLTLHRRLLDEATAVGFAAQTTSEITALSHSLDVDFVLEEAPLSIEQSLQGLAQVASIVKAIKEFSHPGGAEKAPVNLNSAVETTLTVSRNSWKYVAEASTELDPNLPNIMGLAGDIHQVLINLIGNAADAIAERSPEGGGRITVTTRVDDNQVVLCIGDNGNGIEERHLNRIFDPFFTTKEAGKGTGQGLAIVYNIVNIKHGGVISVQSRRGEGTTFTLRFPIEIERTTA